MPSQNVAPNCGMHYTAACQHTLEDLKPCQDVGDAEPVSIQYSERIISSDRAL
ncbi:hypothetical protein BAUCODRAFT_39529 [Baudoinia panamericana UAMH 10762]|uniref:Uncharacterized protein n=1 Tax=Baudoinia panamericana (strain UAMH 10762) TaxID=717646 RepID=M2MJA1_BAUPA|nr:uncharacterized protein BAUCODRAFT_39529 [Baudoinia panamericana UAMH 10762]EMC91358.1 hypothetical protein BAUCODRAFT_39529 [Baudoinia panamericana UAMH 10762]